MIEPAQVLATAVHAGGRSKPFGEVTIAEVHARAAELRASAGWGPTARVATVAQAWSELGRQMERAGARTVAELDPDDVASRAEPLWVVPPGGSLI